MWLSVLGNTTRDTHAGLDGVPAGADNRWALGGVRVRWPADINLPVEERANCRCTVNSEFGMDDAIAWRLIEEYEGRGKGAILGAARALRYNIKRVGMFAKAANARRSVWGGR